MRFTLVIFAAAQSGTGWWVLNDWVHFDAIQALVHHATAVIAAIFLFGMTGRMIAYLIPDGHAKHVVMIIDDVILLAVFALTGYRLLQYMWFRPHMEAPVESAAQINQPAYAGSDVAEELIARCSKLSGSEEEVAQCLQRKDAEAKQALAQASARMTADMHALDKVGSAKVGAARSFDAAEAAFMLYREAECRWRSTSATNDAADKIYRACMATLASQRAAQINEILRR
jgi:Lysozyme inhibitor LprI